MKTGEALLVEARNGKKVFECVPNAAGEYEDIENALKRCLWMTGIRAKNLPTHMEKPFIVDFIRKHYPLFSVAEIVLAFEKAVAGELELDDAKPYENFSVEYLGRIMRAYRSWAVSRLNMIQPPPPPSEKNEVPETPVDYSDLWEILIEDKYDKNYDQFIMWSVIYDWLERIGKINYTKRERWEFIFEARISLIEELQAKKDVYAATPDDKAFLERLKCKDWDIDNIAIQKLIAPSKTLGAKHALKLAHVERKQTT